MGYSRNFPFVFLALIPLYCCQVDISITQPKLTGITAVNSTAWTITWQFANSTYDQSNLIQIFVEFYEFAFNYSPVYSSVNYTFTSTSKNVTSLTRNFQLVNAFYYICFSSNSTITNSSMFLFRRTCQLTRTCTRTNTICGQPSLVLVSNTSVLSNSFVITVQWLQNLPYTPGQIIVQRADNNAAGVLLTLASLSALPYQFSGLTPNTNYVVNIITTYTLLNTSMTNTMNYSVTTSCASTGHLFGFLLWSMLLILLLS